MTVDVDLRQLIANFLLQSLSETRESFRLHCHFLLGNLTSFPETHDPRNIQCPRSHTSRVRLKAMIDGGGHERGMRSGTLNVPGIVGLGTACEIAQKEMTVEAERLTGLRERLKKKISDQLAEVYINGHPTQRLSGNMNMSFAYVEGESLLMALKEIAVSTGSACTSASLEPSHVLRAIGVEEELAHTSIRFGLGRFNTEEEVDYTVRRVVEEVRRLRSVSPLYKARKAKRRGRQQTESKLPERVSQS